MSYLFADDSTILAQYKRGNEQLAATSVNNDLIKLANWAEIWRVKFNATKTVFINFSLNNAPFLPILCLKITLYQRWRVISI